MKKCLLSLFTFMACVFLFETAYACTVIVKSDGKKTLFGNNEDSKMTDTYVRIEPGKDGAYGVLYFSYESLYPQGGMNEKGLAFDGLACDFMSTKRAKGTKDYFEGLIPMVMENCADIDEAMNTLKEYDLSWLTRGQLVFADRNGDTLVLDGGGMYKNMKKDLAATNFHLSQMKPGDPVSCGRYMIASERLEDAPATVDAFAKILSAVRQESKYSQTQYSNICDLKKGIVYLYHFHDFVNAVAIDLKKEFKKGRRVVKIDELFAPAYAYSFYVREKKNTFAAIMETVIRTKGIEAAKDLFEQGLASPGQLAQYEVNKLEINKAGYKFLEEGLYDESIAVFTMYTRLFPSHANAYDSLGEAWYKKGDKKKALENYEKALELNPKSKNAAKYVNKIKKEMK